MKPRPNNIESKTEAFKSEVDYSGLNDEQKRVYNAFVFRRAKPHRSILKTLLICVTLSLISGCCSQKCAERRIQRIVKNHPELIEVKMRTLDTFIDVPGYKEQILVPMSTLAKDETYCEITDHGTFVVHVDNNDTVRIDFVADTQRFRYQDTLKYRQVVVSGPDMKKKSEITFWNRITEWISFLAIGAGLAFYFLFKLFKTNKIKNT